MKIPKRLRPHRSLRAFAVAILGAMTMAAGLAFAGTASATTPGSFTPLINVANGEGNSIPLLLGSPSNPNLSGGAAGGAAYAITAGASAQPAASWLAALNGYGVSPGAWAVGDRIYIPVFPNHVAAACVSGPCLTGVNDYTDGNYVEYSNVPTVLATQSPPVSGATSPCLAAGCGVALITNPNDTAADIAAGLTDVLVITLNNPPGLEAPPPAGLWALAIINVNYTTGANTSYGPILTALSDTDTSTYVLGSSTASGAAVLNNTTPGVQGLYGGALGTPTTTYPPLTGDYGVASNATVLRVAVTVNTPPVSVLPSAINAPISNIVLTESVPNTLDSLGGVPAGYVCVTLSPGEGSFTTTATTPTFLVSPNDEGGTATVSSTVFLTSVNSLDDTLCSDVLVASITVPTTFTLSGITVDAPDNFEGPVGATICVGEITPGDCAFPAIQLSQAGNQNYTTSDGEFTIYTVGQETAGTRIAGSTADQTAAAALEAQWEPTAGGFCVPNNANPDPHSDNVGSSVVLATNDDWPDALVASYLASYYHTGVLLTGPSVLDPYAAQAIQQEGISNVFIVGGDLAISNAIQSTLEATAQYQCGGGVPRTNALGADLDLNVQRIDGPTADDTAQAIDTFVDSGYVGKLDIAGSAGLYNDTLGTSSGSLPTIRVRTAILATDLTFQDATSASSLSYFENLPIIITTPESLSTQAETTLLDLGIQQVIEVGGPDAVADSVNSDLANESIAVLRVAGTDYTDTSVQLADFELNSNVQSPTLQPEGLGWGVYCASSTDDGSGVAAYEPPSVGEGEISGFFPNPGDYFYYFDGTGPNECFYFALARGDYFADALTSSVYTGNIFHVGTTPIFTGPEPVLLTENPSTIGTYLTGFLNQAGSPYGIDPYVITPLTDDPGTGKSPVGVTVFGGIIALPTSTVQSVLNAISAGANA